MEGRHDTGFPPAVTSKDDGVASRISASGPGRRGLPIVTRLLDQKTTFHQMKDADPSEWNTVMVHSLAHKKRAVDRILRHLEEMNEDPNGYAVDRLEHCLQTATRAHRDGRAEEYVVCALLHDMGDTLGCYNHAEVSAAILKPFVSAENHWMVEHHGVFQGYYFFEPMGLDKNARDAFRGHPLFDYTAEFCELYDQCSFDPGYDSMSLRDFTPMLRRVMSKPRSSLYVHEDHDARALPDPPANDSDESEDAPS